MTLDELLDALDEFDGPIPVDRLKEVLGRATFTRADVADRLHFSDEGYQRNPVREGTAYQAFLMCWSDGQRSPIHDHTGSGCGIYVVDGTLVEQCYELDDGGVVVPGERHVLEAGDVCASHDSDKHAVIAEHGDLVTLHVYPPPMSTIGIYREGSAEVESFTYPSFAELESAAFSQAD